MTGCEWLREASARLEEAGVGSPSKEAEVILTGGLGLDRVALYRDNPTLAEYQLAAAGAMLDRRHRREPFHYIAGRIDFCGLELKVGPGVLIPRPETELLVEEGVKALTVRSPRLHRADAHPLRQTPDTLHLLDLCTGSGCIALALAKAFPHAVVHGTDCSERALSYALTNAERNNIKSVLFHCGDLYGPVTGMRFDLIVANPPYVRTRDIAGLQPEVREWEPVEALNGGEDGLSFYRRIINEAAAHLKEEGLLLLELGFAESDDVMGMAKAAGFGALAVVTDYSGIERILSISR